MKQDRLFAADKRLLGWQPLSRLLIVFAIYAWGSTPVLLARSVMTVGTGTQLAIAVVTVATMGGLGVLLAGPMARLFRLPALSDNTALFLALAGGVMVRLAWILVFHPAPASDGLTYLSLARHIIDGAGLALPGAIAFWPPGYPLFLAPFLLVLLAAFA